MDKTDNEKDQAAAKTLREQILHFEFRSTLKTGYLPVSTDDEFTNLLVRLDEAERRRNGQT